MLARAATGAALASGAALYSYAQYREWLSLRASSASAAAHLPTVESAQRTSVVRARGVFSASDIAAVHALQASHARRMGTAGRTEGNTSAAYRAGAWETSYLSTEGLFKERLPQLRDRLVALAHEVDTSHEWQVLTCATAPVVPRCVELHAVERGGSLPYPEHYDSGSLVTIDVMLSDPSEFEGGEFSTLEADGKMAHHSFEKGDALVFVSHKYHCVSPVTSGTRHVLVCELWEGEERECAHRCERHTGHCGHSARASFWQRALADMASDL